MEKKITIEEPPNKPLNEKQIKFLTKEWFVPSNSCITFKTDMGIRRRIWKGEEKK